MTDEEKLGLLVEFICSDDFGEEMTREAIAADLAEDGIDLDAAERRFRAFLDDTLAKRRADKEGEHEQPG